MRSRYVVHTVWCDEDGCFNNIDSTEFGADVERKEFYRKVRALGWKVPRKYDPEENPDLCPGCRRHRDGDETGS